MYVVHNFMLAPSLRFPALFHTLPLPPGFFNIRIFCITNSPVNFKIKGIFMIKFCQFKMSHPPEKNGISLYYFLSLSL